MSSICLIEAKPRRKKTCQTATRIPEQKGKLQVVFQNKKENYRI